MPVRVVAILVALARHHAKPDRARRCCRRCRVKFPAQTLMRSAIRAPGLARIMVCAAHLQSRERELMNTILLLAHIRPLRFDRIREILAQRIAHAHAPCHCRTRALDLIRRRHGFLRLRFRALAFLVECDTARIPPTEFREPRPYDCCRVSHFADTHAGRLMGSTLCSPRERRYECCCGSRADEVAPRDATPGSWIGIHGFCFGFFSFQSASAFLKFAVCGSSVFSMCASSSAARRSTSAR